LLLIIVLSSNASWNSVICQLLTNNIYCSERTTTLLECK